MLPRMTMTMRKTSLLIHRSLHMNPTTADLWAFYYKRMKRFFSSMLALLAKHKLLLFSAAANILLSMCCILLLSELKQTYTDYRHFRSLGIGTSQATTAESRDNSIVLFGDSRIETWGPAPYSDKYTFINAGVTGETTTEMRRRVERDVIALNPDYVLIQAGVNDLTAAVTKGIKQPDQLVSTMHENFEFFIETLERQNINVIVTSILPALHLNTARKVFWHDTLSKEINLANSKLKATTEALNADWLNLDPLFLDESSQPATDLYYDTLHINKQGYRVLNATLKEFIDNL